MRLLLIGAGHSHLFVLEAFAARPEPHVALTLVTPQALTTYSGMVPGVLGGAYAAREAQIDARRLAERAGARFVAARAAAVDPAARRLTLSDGGTLDFDLASFDIGARGAAIAPADPAAPLVPIKPIDAALAAIESALAARPSGRALVIGAGAGGCEVALALAARLAGRPGAVTLVDRAAAPLPDMARRASRLMARALAAAGVAWRGAIEIAALEAGGARLRGGESLPADLIVAAAGVEAQPLFAAAGLPVDGRGFLLVDDSLRCLAAPAIFAAGDTATLAAHPRLPKSGVHAVRQGPLLAANLRAALRGEPLLPYRPRRRTLALLNTADRRAILAWGPLALHAGWAWHLKDRIDRAFIRRFDG